MNVTIAKPWKSKQILAKGCKYAETMKICKKRLMAAILGLDHLPPPILPVMAAPDVNKKENTQ